jgi:hypothetical protein
MGFLCVETHDVDIRLVPCSMFLAAEEGRDERRLPQETEHSPSVFLSAADQGYTVCPRSRFIRSSSDHLPVKPSSVLCLKCARWMVPKNGARVAVFLNIEGIAPTVYVVSIASFTVDWMSRFRCNGQCDIPVYDVSTGPKLHLLIFSAGWNMLLLLTSSSLFLQVTFRDISLDLVCARKANPSIASSITASLVFLLPG